MAKIKKRLPIFMRGRHLLVVGGFIVVGIITWYFLHGTNSTNSNSTTSSNNGYTNLNPPTQADKNEVQAHKEQIAQDQPNTVPADGSKKTVTPLITNADKDTVGAYIPQIFEDGGICTAIAVFSSSTVTKTSVGFKNASYTSCPPINLSLSKGSWTISVSYNSSAAQGRSEAITVEVK